MKNKEYDIIVIGAGPSGVAASISSASNGAKVLIIDSNINLGGQVYKPPPNSFKEIKNNTSKEIKIQRSFNKIIRTCILITEFYILFIVNNRTTNFGSKFKIFNKK